MHSRIMLLALCVAALPLAAQTLPQAWQQAERASQQLLAQQAEQQAAAAGTRAARAAAGAQLSIGGQWQQRDRAPMAQADLDPLRTALGALGNALPAGLQVPLDDDHGGAFEAVARYPLYTGGKLDALLQAALSGEALAAAATERARQDVRLEVATAFYNVLRSRELNEVAQQQWQALQALRRDVGALYGQGVVARVDVLGADVAVADALQKQLAAGHALSLAQAAYNRLQGVALDSPVWPEPAPLAATLPSEAELLQQAQQARPELAALRAARDGQQYQAGVTASAARPQVAAFARYQYSQNPMLVHAGSAAIGIGVEWQLFDSGLVRARAAGDLARADAIAARLQDAQSLIALDIRRARNSVLDAAERERQASASVAQAAEFLHIQQQRYRNGLAPQTDVLLAQTRDADARRALLNAHHDHAQAYWQLQRASGRL